MNDRKQHVVKMAHQLFIEKGFQATSIQDILDYSGISKGTFYNYFPSKNELLMAIFKMIHTQLEKQRTELLIGQDPTNIEVFIKQIVMQMKTNRKNKLIDLYEEVMVSNDTDLKEYIEKGQFKNIHWIYQRFIDIFGESKQPYLLDSAIMFMGILRQNIKFYHLAYDSANIDRVVRFSVNRLVKMVDEAANSKDQLIEPELLENWLPDCKKADVSLLKKLHHTIITIKNASPYQEHSSYLDLLDFIEDELTDSKHPRKFLIDSSLLSIKSMQGNSFQRELEVLEGLVEEYFTQVHDTRG